MSKITVHYQELRSFGNFQNAQVGLSVDIEGESIPAETADAVLAQSKDWVRAQLDQVQAEAGERLRDQRAAAEIAWEAEQQQRLLTERLAQVDAAAETVERVEAFLRRHHLPIPWTVVERDEAFDVPF